MYRRLFPSPPLPPQAWLEFPDHLVGFPGRIHAFDEATEAWKYVSSWENNISLILTGASFYHKVGRGGEMEEEG